MSEPYCPEPAPKAPRYVVRDMPLCPVCSGMTRRDLRDPEAGDPHGPWRCDLHGVVEPVWEQLEVPTGDEPLVDTPDVPSLSRKIVDREEDAYDLSDPKHPRHHDVYADYADLSD